MNPPTFAAVSIAAFSILVSSAALAEPPSWCTGSGATGYNQGYDLEYNLLQNIWSTRFDCNTLEDFVAAVEVPTPSSSSSSLFLDCRNVGIAESIWAVIAEKQNECAVDCYDNGADIGETQAAIYCNLPEPYEAQMLAFPLCSITSEQGCEAALRSSVTQNCPEAAGADPGYEEFVAMSCNFE
jgi:hypothetical protein